MHRNQHYWERMRSELEEAVHTDTTEVTNEHAAKDYTRQCNELKDLRTYYEAHKAVWQRDELVLAEAAIAAKEAKVAYYATVPKVHAGAAAVQ